ncbi:unnamed protein product [Allacma fusca]|uniref:Uncharacterized protein n=1 Tax=Allacma fusca TaxID=39272 RepID=A0A8J2P739_9HEXA|nr:unnamed protein product [Allacma fusca]
MGKLIILFTYLALRALVAEHLVTIKEGVRDLTHHNVIPGTRINTDFEELLDLIPISGKSELEEFDLWLNQDGKLKILKRYLGSLGGNWLFKICPCTELLLQAPE